jgi:hypothetical protein
MIYLKQSAIEATTGLRRARRQCIAHHDNAGPSLSGFQCLRDRQHHWRMPEPIRRLVELGLKVKMDLELLRPR